MPVAFFSTGNQSAAIDVGARSLIPGVEPGGSRAGKSKPALLIRDAWFEVQQWTPGTDDFENVSVFLKLSQENDLTPGLILPIGTISSLAAGTAGTGNALVIEQLGDKIAGTMWAPRVVGIRFQGGNVPTNWTINVYLDYDVVMVEWMDWFIMWDYLDNTSDNAREW